MNRLMTGEWRLRTVAFALSLFTAACASAPPPAPPAVKAPAGATFEQKMASILSLEDHRMLRDPAPAAPPPVPPDLTLMLSDSEARIRRRAALAIGRVGLADGVPPLLAS
jgi:hypothetical protein